MDLRSYIELKEAYKAMHSPQAEVVSEEVEVVEEEILDEALKGVDGKPLPVTAADREAVAAKADAAERQRNIDSGGAKQAQLTRQLRAKQAETKNRRAERQQARNDTLERERNINSGGARKANQEREAKAAAAKNDLATNLGGIPGSKPNNKPTQTKPPQTKPTQTKPTQTKPTTGSGSGGSRPTSTPAAKPPSKPDPKPQSKDMGANMRAWSKANPNLAKKVKPGQSGYKTINPQSKPSAGASAAMSAAKPAPKPNVNGIKSGRLATALSSVNKFKAEETSMTDFDIILEHLVEQGFPFEEALKLMVNMPSEKKDQILGEAEKPFPHEKVKAKQVALRDKEGGKALERRMKMGLAVRRAKEAEKTGGSQKDAGKDWYHAKEEFELWVDSLLEEGYDLSDYTWDDMYEFYLQEAYLQLDEISQKTATKAYAASKTDEFEGKDSPRDIKRTDNLKRQIKRKFGDNAVKHADRAAHARTFGRKGLGGMPPKPTKEEFESIEENRRAARSAGGYVDDSKKQTDPSKDGFTGISGSIKDIMRQNKEIEARSKKQKTHKEEMDSLYQAYLSMFTEEESDKEKDSHLERGGHAARADYDKAPKQGSDAGKKKGSDMSALEKVKAEFMAKHGKGAIIDTKKKKED